MWGCVFFEQEGLVYTFFSLSLTCPLILTIKILTNLLLCKAVSLGHDSFPSSLLVVTINKSFIWVTGDLMTLQANGPLVSANIFYAAVLLESSLTWRSPSHFASSERTLRVVCPIFFFNSETMRVFRLPGERERFWFLWKKSLELVFQTKETLELKDN